MSFLLLFLDELYWFYKSKVMLVLWIGLPVVVVLFHLTTPDTGSMPYSTTAALLISSLGGTLASVMLVVTIVNEKIKHIYDLFIIRPLWKPNLILAKFAAVYCCLAVAGAIAIILGFAIDMYSSQMLTAALVDGILESFAVSLSMMALGSAIATLIGVLAPSLLVGVILVIFGCNQLSVLPILPIALEFPSPIPITLALGFGLAGAVLALAVIVFAKQQA